MICRRSSELFKIHSQTLHHKLPLSHFQPHRRITLCPSSLFQYNSTKPIYNYESFLNRKLEFFTWAHILSSWREEIDWYERSLSINMSATQRKQLVNKSTSADRIHIADERVQYDHHSTMNHQKACVFCIINISGTQG